MPTVDVLILVLGAVLAVSAVGSLIFVMFRRRGRKARAPPQPLPSPQTKPIATASPALKPVPSVRVEAPATPGRPVSVPVPGICYYHPHLPAVYVCNRCGRSICRDDSKGYMDFVLCPQCYAGVVPPVAAPMPQAPAYGPVAAPVPSMRVCPNCGTPYGYDAQFCMNCGEKIRDAIPITAKVHVPKSMRPYVISDLNVYLIGEWLMKETRVVSGRTVVERVPFLASESRLIRIVPHGDGFEVIPESQWSGLPPAGQEYGFQFEISAHIDDERPAKLLVDFLQDSKRLGQANADIAISKRIARPETTVITLPMRVLTVL